MRSLNTDEAAILAVKEKRLGKKLPVTGIEYRTAFPRTTICILEKDRGYRGDISLKDFVIGSSMRGKGEADIPMIGERVAYTRALNAIE